MQANNALGITEFLSKLSNVKSAGGGHTARCPAHEDKRNSLSIRESDEGKLLIHCHAGCSFQAVVDAVGVDPQSLFPQKFEEPKKKITATYNYTDITGKLLYQAVRYSPKSFMQRQPDPVHPKKWIYNLKGVQLVPYKLPEVIEAIKTGKTIFITEGEKDCQSLEAIGLVATTNSGGAGKWRKEFTQYFSSANIILIADNDEPGRNHVEKVAKFLSPVASSISVANIDGLEKGQDVTDYLRTGGTREQLIDIAQNSPLWSPDEPTAPDKQPDIKPEYDDPTSPPFRILGFNEGLFYYMPDEDLQLIRMSADQHTQASLIALAPLSWWEASFPSKSGTDWNSARNYLYRMSKRKGIYDSRRLRGCGTWYDNHRVVQHNGNMLIVDGQAFKIDEFKTNFIYNASYPIETSQADPLDNAEAKKFLDICKMPSWEKSISGTLLAGWCVIAPVCGALYWRPHIWITGSSGTGKTWITDNIIKIALGNTALNVQSNTTEAGIRQWLGISAFPVTIDEAEGEDMSSRKRLQSVVELMRQASSETGAPIVKGSAHGNAVEFKIRSCFCLSSVGVNIHQKADASRITVLSLKRPHKKDVVDLFDLLKDSIKVVNPEYCASLRSRTTKLIPVILQNARIFGRAIAEKFGDQRIGDQFGVLVAGAYSLTSNKVITIDQAHEWIAKQDWTEQSSIEDISDEERCLNRIFEHTIQYLIDNHRMDKQISEIIFDNHISEAASLALERVGIKYKETDDGRVVIISDSHAGMQKLLKNTEHEKTWGRILKRYPGAVALSSYRFMGKGHRATQIPTNRIYGIIENNA